jgi:hypothetical protein
MNLSTSSWHVRLYKLAYGSYSCLPTNLCPYFWKVLWALILFIPCQLLLLPVYLFKDVRDMLEIEGYISAHLGIGFFMYLALGVVYVLTFGLFSHNDALRHTAHVMWVILSLVGICILIGMYLDRKEEDSLITAFIKAKYNKYCPKINWRK